MQTTEHSTYAAGWAFDSLAYAKHMEAVGFTRQQAEALAEEQGKLIDERLATKHDITILNGHLAQVKADLEVKIAELDVKVIEIKTDLEVRIAGVEVRIAEAESRLEANIAQIDIKLAETKADIIKWLFGISFAQATLIIAVLKLHG